MNAFDLLKADHRKVKDLFVQITNTTSRDSQQRETLFRMIKQELEIHTKIEEAYLYPTAQKHNETKDLVQHSLEEHHQMKQLLQDLSQKEVDSESWMPTFKTLQEVTEDHIEEEESELFPNMKVYLSPEAVTHMGDELQTMKNRELESMKR